MVMARVNKTPDGYVVVLDENEAALIEDAWADEQIGGSDPYYGLMVTLGRSLRAFKPRDIEVTVTVSAGVVGVLMAEQDARTVSQLGAGLAVIDLVGTEVRKAMRA